MHAYVSEDLLILRKVGKSTVVEINKHALLSLKTETMINIISKSEILHLNL